MSHKIIVEKSKEILLDCCLRNGAIVAANTDRPDYPHNVQSYRYVWPRDAAYICYALGLLGCLEEQANYFRWLKRAEDLNETGLLFQNYYTHGRKRWLSFQPDQNGSTLWAIHNFLIKYPSYKQEFLPLVRLLADGLCRVWNKDHFSIVTQDLWETFYTYPELKTTFTYSIAACCRGLLCANELHENQEWRITAQQMKKKIEASTHNGFFLRRCGAEKDFRLDSSILGIFWPFEIFGPEDKRIRNTLKHLAACERNGGVYRFQFDDYDGFRFQGIDAYRGAGAWPILNFWMSICYSKLGNKKKAVEYFDWVIERLDENLNIPEQIFENKELVSIKPLAWSHAMFIIAAAELGIL
ncbi:MAG: glycoside hydrolase family 15 protein [Candidatus Woesearchaeota archaeon]